MASVAICTDSSALFPAGVAERLGVAVVPVPVALDGVPFDEDEQELDVFYARMADGAKATTSQPSPAAFLSAYMGVAASGATEVLSLHVDGRVSATVAAAELAARESPIPVSVVDTRTASFGVALCVRAAAKAIAACASTAAAGVAALSAGAGLRNAFVAPAPPRGRLPEASGWAVLEFADGASRPVSACDGVEEAIEIMSARVADSNASVHAAVGYAASVTEPAADRLATLVDGLSSVVGVERYRVGASVGAHTGPLSFGVFWWPAPGP